MAEKDVTEKILESYNDVFSDIVNVLLFGGKEVVAPDELEDQAPRAYYKADGKVRELERDVAKRWKKGNIRVACIGFENQTQADPDMPLRIMGYDGAEYRSQLTDGETSRYPVVTLVLYFGCKKHWDKPLSLKERLSIPPEFEPFVNDYKVHLFEVAYLTHEQVELFQSDFRIVADYFVQKREKGEHGEYTPDPRQIRHVQETLQLLSVMTRDHRFEEAYNEAYTKDGMEGGPHTMCEFLDRVENRGIEKGLSEGRAEGLREGLTKGLTKGRTEGEAIAKREIAFSLQGMGMPVEKIAEAVKVSVETVKQWLASPQQGAAK